MKPQANLRAIVTSLAITLLTLAICYLLTGLALTSAGYPMW